ncbi:MAG: DnaD domain protein [Oscillospiraceae bacterium]|nr:DnaD domain protein [Oscillospiraceae bacterium]
MRYKVNWDSGGVFAVPDIAADCLKLASGKAVKVLLYILKNKTSDIDPAAFAEIGVSAEDAEDAVSYWQQVGLLYTGDTAPVTDVPEKAAASVSAPVSVPADSAAQRAKERASKMLPPEEIAERIEGSSDIKFLFDSAESTLGRILNYTEQRTLIWLHDYYGITPDLLLMIMDFAKQINKASIGYIEKIAISWHDSGITTHEQAEREIMSLQSYFSAEGQVTARLELSRKLTPTEKKFVHEWTDKGISIDLIVYSYEKTVDNIGKVKFSYMNKILTDWHQKGISTVSEAMSDTKGPSDKNNPSVGKKDSDNEHSYNLDLLLEHAMNNTPKIKK